MGEPWWTPSTDIPKMVYFGRAHRVLHSWTDLFDFRATQMTSDRSIFVVEPTPSITDRSVPIQIIQPGYRSWHPVSLRGLHKQIGFLELREPWATNVMLQGTKIDRLVPRLTSPTPLTIRVQPLMATQHFEAQALLNLAIGWVQKSSFTTLILVSCNLRFWVDDGRLW